MSIGKVVSLALGVFVGLLGLSVVFGSWYTVSEGYRGVVTRNGAISSIAEPGLHTKMPWIDSVTSMSVQTEKLVFDKGVNTYSRDIQQFNAIITLTVSLDTSKVDEVYKKYGTDWQNKLVPNAFRQSFKEQAGHYDAPDIVAHRDRLALETLNAMREWLGPLGVNVESVAIDDIKFTAEYEHAIEQAAAAEANVKTAKQELAKARVDYEKQVADADAKAKATRTRAEAEAFAIEAKGKAEAAAIDARGKALANNAQLVNLIAAEKWDGKLPATMVPGGAVPFVSVK